MGHAPLNATVETGAWELVASYATKKPRGVRVANTGETNSVEVFIVPLHGDEEPEVSDDGAVIGAGGSEPFVQQLPRQGDGLITAVYCRSDGTDVNVAVQVG